VANSCEHGNEVSGSTSRDLYSHATAHARELIVVSRAVLDECFWKYGLDISNILIPWNETCLIVSQLAKKFFPCLWKMNTNYHVQIIHTVTA
jgi:hypothetical protein